jgi:hypothetical protein
MPARGRSSSFHRFPVILSRSAIAALGLLVLHPAEAPAQVPSQEVQIAMAVQAAPADRRDGARVLGYAEDGSVVVLREGENDLVCLSDNPKQEGFSAACYHVSIEPYMARGRELRAQGVEDPERTQRRWEEAEAGTLPMPEKPATMYVLSGESYDPATGEITERYLRYVIYTPWATAEETGLPTRPIGPASPWLMFPGTAGAHIMVSPPQEGG